MKIPFSTIRDAFDFVSSGPPDDHVGYVDLHTGRTYIHSEVGDNLEELPEDLDDPRYLAIPHKNELQLGRRLVLDFAHRYLPNEEGQVAAFFNRKGAWSRLKEFLAEKGMLDQWYAFESEAEDRALRQWCEDNGIEFDEG